ncbi:site-specific DNA-methyltransferase [Pectobacterium actinidiae]|uniref:site-specific DNA-methyltransferase (adenine-specific) n=1 Tax=Pectobacterium actinidiae TaxID=1507808 RepID=A0A1V2R934_9GAMM|nr:MULTISPECIES: site-specific DNA-methyltransferase [Pectobacterium]KHN90296.1 adenine-specific DNA-methyltransferase [Pectobacterium actinidiae]MBQ4773877.1 site-specific DNA-methyltransferase [Pectobacterium versatile]ONK07177.1 site-specific DNA-methyltransferase [Pectobacterium actinidiae]ONK08908.1 site-specific DNA-methyltransferase [Pectobacterium actinidiae]
MPTLNWIGKEAVIKHHKDVPFRLLEHDADLSHGQDDSGNIIVQGDNLQALKALLPRYAGQVKCIYIDPPYNTGNEGWVYNDNVNSPEIRKWLGEVVGKEGETLDRHDRWLSMMYPRLVLLKQFLRDDGVIFVSIDDNEIGNLQSLMREIFGAPNEIATIVWGKGKKGDAKLVAVTHEYIVAFSKNKDFLKKQKTRWRRKKPGVDEVLEHYNNLRKKHLNDHIKIRNDMMSWYRSLSKDDPRKAHKHYNWSDERGLYFPDNFHGPDDGRENRPRYPIIHPITQQPCAIPSTGWRWEENKTKAALADSPPRIHFGKDHTTIPNRKSYLSEIDEEPMLSVFYKDGRGATLEVEKILGPGAFPFPKDSAVVADLIGMVSQPGDVVLDSFAGSGTTAHAVLQLNQGNKKPINFILIEMDNNVAINKTRERIRKAIDGYVPLTGKKRNSVAGLGSGFQYFRLSKEPLFLPNGPIRHDVTFNQLREFIWFMETGSGLTVSPLAKEQPATPFLGVHQEKAVFLLYNGILKDRSDIGGNVLNHRSLKFLDEITPPHFSGTRVVYAARSRFDKKKLNQLGITFHQLPYELAVKTWL